jgi:uncharacterized protein involved in exopolysaccharide biosynthesis
MNQENKGQEQDSSSAPFIDDSIDLIALIKSLWQARGFIVKVTAGFAVLGLLVAFLSPVHYTAKSTFVPQTPESKTSGSLSGLAALAGVNLSAAGDGTYIPASLYPNILASAPFRQEILATALIVQGDTITYKDYLLTKAPNILTYVKRYTLGLPGMLLSVLKAQPESSPVGGQESIIQLTDADYELYKSLEEVITVESSLEEGFVSLSVTDSDPMIAAQVAKATEVALQQRIINYKIESSKSLYDFVTAQFLEKQKEVYSTQNKLAYYKDRSRNFFTAQISVEGQRLESEFGVANAVYLELAKQKEQASIQLKKDTPIFAVLEPVVVPKEKSAPKRGLMLAIFTFLGLVLSSGYILFREPIISLRKEITS